ncbi:MAG: EAL domain-containing protein [Tatlockia sp.]|nr:EAL domain-containing protein [Tatlockia sp.]
MKKLNLFINHNDKQTHHQEDLKTDEKIKRNLQLSKDCVIVFDLNGKVLLFNEAAARNFPFFTENVIGQKLVKLISLKALPHKRLFNKVIHYFSLTVRGVPQQFQWITHKAKKPTEAYNVLLTVTNCYDSKVIIVRIIDSLEEKTLEWVLLSLAKIGNRGSINDVIDDVTKLAAKVFQTDYALVNLIDDKNEVHTVSNFFKAEKQNNISYPLANSPCELVCKEKKIFHFNNDLQTKFPKSIFLRNLNLRGYLGGPLFSSTGKVTGVLFLMSENKIELNSLNKSVFRLFIHRISLEIERLISNKKLQFLASFPEQAPNPIISIRTNGEVLYSNKSGSELLHYWSRNEGKIPLKLIEACQQAQQHNEVIRKEFEVDRQVYLFTLSGVQNFSQINIYATDISDLKFAQEKMRDLANNDRITGIANRQYFDTTLTKNIIEAKKNEQQFALLLIDLDNFKSVNDTLGHHIGDFLLKTLARRISGCIRRGDFIARVGGDEFVVLLKVKEQGGVAFVAEKINRALATPFELGDYHIETSCSIGISFYPQNGTTNSELLKNADIAMYQAKKKGRNQFVMFSNTKDFGQSKRHNIIKRDLKNSYLNDQLYIDYQPQFDLNSAKIVGFEAFLRWRHPKQGLISPNEFIPLAEQTGSIYSIGYWVINQALEDYKKTMMPITDSKLSLNITLTQLNDQKFLDYLCENIERLNLNNNRVVLDIAEQNPTLQHLQLDEHLLAIHNEGIQLSLDNYGSAQSSLSRLLEVPINIVKIDHNYLHSLEEHPRNKAFIGGIIDLAHKLDLQVFQKGVENESQNDVLKSLGCQFAQGFYYCPPLPIHVLQIYLNKYSKLN